MMAPFFTIIIPTYNSENNLNHLFKSIFSQTFENFEVLIIDGDSKDSTISLSQSYNDNRIKIHSEPDKGVYDAMNKGIKLAKGEWLYFIGSDDFLYNDNVLENVAKKLKRTNRNVFYGNVLIKGNTGWAKDGQIYNGKFSFQKLLKSNICHQSMFYRSTFIKDNQLFYDLNYPVCADWDFNIKCRELTKFLYDETIVAVFNAGGMSTGEINEPFLIERKEKYKHLYNRHKLTLVQRILIKLKKYSR